jgi:hypothetical protein
MRGPPLAGDHDHRPGNLPSAISQDVTPCLEDLRLQEFFLDAGAGLVASFNRPGGNVTDM